MPRQNELMQLQIVTEAAKRARPANMAKVGKITVDILSDRCPRCHGIMLNDNGEPWCLNCGPSPGPTTVRQKIIVRVSRASGTQRSPGRNKTVKGEFAV